MALASRTPRPWFRALLGVCSAAAIATFACNRTATRLSRGSEGAISVPPRDLVATTDAGTSPPPASVTDADATRRGIDTVLLISVDGLAPRFLEQLLDAGQAPTFAELQREGAFTHNARTEARITVTIPNHTSMISSRPAVDVPGMPADTAHGYLGNSDPGEGVTLHNGGNPNLPYVTSVFDEVHDRGGYTALYSGKSKFLLMRRSYSSPYGRPDVIGEDDGQDKIDDFDVIWDSPTLVERFLEQFSAGVAANPSGPNFALLHYRDTDSQGHGYGWGGPEYLAAVAQADLLIGRVIAHLRATPAFARTLVIITADHGGVDQGHYDPTDILIYRIPFYVYGPGVPKGVDLYTASAGTRVDPGTLAPLDEEPAQPIRNGDAGNLALGALGLPPIEGSLHRGMLLPDVFPAATTP